MLGTMVAMSVFELGQWALMGVGGAACAWLPLSVAKPGMRRRRVLLAMCCALGMAGAGLKMLTGSTPAQSSAATAPAPAHEDMVVVEAVSPTTQPTTAPSVLATRTADKPQPAGLGEARPQDSKNPSPKLTLAKAPADHDLADAHIDHTNGYSIRFPAGWTSTQFGGGDPWFIEVSDGKTGLISVGFSPFPASAGIDQLNPAKLAAHFAAQKKTTVQAKGYGTIDGQPCVWFKYSGPVKSATGEQPMTVIHYYVPLHDGRMFELRMATVPDAFAKMGPVLKKSAASVKLLPA